MCCYGGNKAKLPDFNTAGSICDIRGYINHFQILSLRVFFQTREGSGAFTGVATDAPSPDCAFGFGVNYPEGASSTKNGIRLRNTKVSGYAKSIKIWVTNGDRAHRYI